MSAQPENEKKTFPSLAELLNSLPELKEHVGLIVRKLHQNGGYVDDHMSSKSSEVGATIFSRLKFILSDAPPLPPRIERDHMEFYSNLWSSSVWDVLLTFSSTDDDSEKDYDRTITILKKDFNILSRNIVMILSIMGDRKLNPVTNRIESFKWAQNQIRSRIPEDGSSIWLVFSNPDYPFVEMMERTTPKITELRQFRSELWEVVSEIVSSMTNSNTPGETSYSFVACPDVLLVFTQSDTESSLDSDSLDPTDPSTYADRTTQFNNSWITMIDRQNSGVVSHCLNQLYVGLDGMTHLSTRGEIGIGADILNPLKSDGVFYDDTQRYSPNRLMQIATLDELVVFYGL